MRVISAKLISANECDTLLKVANSINVANQNTIKSQEKTIQLQDIKQLTTEHLVDDCETNKAALKEELDSTKTAVKWIKGGWALTAVVLSVTTVLALVK